VLRSFAALFLVCLAAPAHAYLDPGTGSILLQSLIGALAVGAAAVGTFYGRIRAFFTSRKKSTDVAGETGATREH
jgi:hypothetical protein